MAAQHLAALEARAGCSCECTDRTLNPSRFRLGEHHVSVYLDTWPESANIRVALDGQQQRGAIEALAGHDGWVLRFRGSLDCVDPFPGRPGSIQPHVAGCGRHACVERVYGDVSIVREVPDGR